MTRGTKVILVAAALCIAVVCTHAVVRAQQSTTAAAPIDKKGKIWHVEISRESLAEMEDEFASRHLSSTMEGLKLGFAEGGAGELLSVGFRWKKSMQAADCRIFAVDRGKLDQKRILVYIPFDTGRSCSKRALSLRAVVERHRIARVVDYVKRQQQTQLALLPQIELMQAIVLLADAQLSSLSQLPAQQITKKGYIVRQGDTLSSIAVKLTGNASAWKGFSVSKENVSGKTKYPHVIFPKDRVVLPPSVAKAFLTASLPGAVYPAAKLGPELKNMGIPLDGAVLRSLGGMNYHMVDKVPGVRKGQTQSIWIPHVATGWQEIAVRTYDPLATSQAVYGTAAYQVVVGTLCTRARIESKGNCILPKLSRPVKPEDLKWLKNRFRDRRGSGTIDR